DIHGCELAEAQEGARKVCRHLLCAVDGSDRIEDLLLKLLLLLFDLVDQLQRRRHGARKRAVDLLQSGKDGGDVDAKLRVGWLDCNNRENYKPRRCKCDLLSQWVTKYTSHCPPPIRPNSC